jgi:hypothetical protein
MLFHASVKRNIIILAPATKWVKKEDGVLVSLLHELFTSILEQKDVSVVERVANLESVDSISILLLDLFSDLARGQSVLVQAIVESDTFVEVGRFSRNEPVTLGHDGLSLGVVGREAAEGTSADLLLSVLEEGGLVHNSVDTVVAEGSAPQSNLRLLFEGSLLFASHVLSDGNRKKVALAKSIGHGLHVH